MTREETASTGLAAAARAVRALAGSGRLPARYVDEALSLAGFRLVGALDRHDPRRATWEEFASYVGFHAALDVCRHERQSRRTMPLRTAPADISLLPAPATDPVADQIDIDELLDRLRAALSAGHRGGRSRLSLPALLGLAGDFLAVSLGRDTVEAVARRRGKLVSTIHTNFWDCRAALRDGWATSGDRGGRPACDTA